MTQAAATITPTEVANKSKLRILPIGFALFAMFFGAGNIVYPLAIGAQSGQHLVYAVIGFLLFGVGAPFLGLFATSLFHGNYEEFFNRLGKIPAFLIITFLMFIIGPLFAMPRTEVVTYQTVQPFIGNSINSITFSLIYCVLVFLLTYKETRFMNVLGYILSPLKLISFTALIILGLSFSTSSTGSEHTAIATFTNSVVQGYNTMDLLAAFFFCSIAYSAIQRQAAQSGNVDQKELVMLTLKSCMVGAICLAVIYIGFMLTASFNAINLQHINTEQMITVISQHVLGRFGSFFVALCITFACLATAMALAEVTSNYLYHQIFRKKISKVFCLTIVIAVMFIMSNLGFAGIMALATPILIVLYPALIVLCFVNILYKVTGFKYVKLPVAITIALSIIGNFYI